MIQKSNLNDTIPDILPPLMGETKGEYIARLNTALTNPYQKYVLDLRGNIAFIDAYTVLNAFPQGAEVDHAVKKLVAMGKRNGGKSRLQDVTEARNQLNKEIFKLEALDCSY